MKKVLSFLMLVSMFLCGTNLCGTNSTCFALFSSEEYYSCFEKQDSAEIVVSKISEEDKKILKSMIDEDPDFAKCLGYGIVDFNSDEFLETVDHDCKLVFTIKNKDNVVLGLMFANQGSNENQLNVGYWIGKEFRGKGYAHLAVSQIILKIWDFDKSVSFEFWIDDENIASIKTLRKICEDLKIDSKSSRFIKSNSIAIETVASKEEDDNYLIKTYVNSVLSNSNTITKEQFLKLYSEDKLEGGVLLKTSSSMYLIKIPNLAIAEDSEGR